MKIHITLEHDFGHPGNQLSKSYLLKLALEKFDEVQIKSNVWRPTKIEIEQ